jgi:hypothetical protein
MALAQPAIETEGKVAMYSTLGWVATQEKRYEAAEAAYASCVKSDPRRALCSYRLGDAIASQEKAAKMSAALFHFARASVLEGPGSFTPSSRQTTADYLKRAYSFFHGNLDGIDALVAAAKEQPFPPAGFQISMAAQPVPANPAAIALWRNLRKGLTGADGQTYFTASVKGALVPGGANSVERFLATIVSVDLTGKQAVLQVSVDGGSEADAELRLAGSPTYRLVAGNQIEFAGVPVGFIRSPYKLVMQVNGIRKVK